MSKKNPKEAFNHDINAELAKQFERIVDKLPGKKYEILEAALKCYLALPREKQLFWLLDPELQKMIKT